MGPPLTAKGGLTRLSAKYDAVVSRDISERSYTTVSRGSPHHASRDSRVGSWCRQVERNRRNCPLRALPPYPPAWTRTAASMRTGLRRQWRTARSVGGEHRREHACDLQGGLRCRGPAIPRVLDRPAREVHGEPHQEWPAHNRSFRRLRGEGRRAGEGCPRKVCRGRRRASKTRRRQTDLVRAE